MPRKKVALVFSSSNTQFIMDRLVGEFDHQGFDAIEYTDGDPDLLDADAIILAADISKLTKTVRLLMQNAASRPPTIAWAYEPVIPNDFAAWANTWASRAIATAQAAKRHQKLMRRLTRLMFVSISLFGTGPWGRSLTAKELQFSYAYTLALKSGLNQGWIDGVACSTYEKKDTVAYWGAPTTFAPLSIDWKPEREPAFEEKRDIDVLFLGRLSNWRRTTRLMRLSTKLRRAGYNVKIVTHGLRGKERDAVLDRTRIVLHLTKYPWDTAWMRFYMASTHGAAVVSETLSNPSPMRPGQDFKTADARDLETQILGLLTDEAERQQCVSNCRQTIDAKMSFRQSVAAMIALAEQAKDKGKPCRQI